MQYVLALQPLIVAVSRESPPLEEEATAQADTSVDSEDYPAFETEPPRPSFLLILLRALSAWNT